MISILSLQCCFLCGEEVVPFGVLRRSCATLNPSCLADIDTPAWDKAAHHDDRLAM